MMTVEWMLLSGLSATRCSAVHLASDDQVVVEGQPDRRVARQVALDLQMRSDVLVEKLRAGMSSDCPSAHDYSLRWGSRPSAQTQGRTQQARTTIAPSICDDCR